MGRIKNRERERNGFRKSKDKVDNNGDKDEPKKAEKNWWKSNKTIMGKTRVKEGEEGLMEE